MAMDTVPHGQIPNRHEYYQDDKTVKESEQIKGHAVSAMYLYTGTADVAAVTADKDYLKAMERVWEDVVYRNMYLTGGIGSSGNNEGFTNDYDLPNLDAYCETCASVGMVLWNQRMNLLTGESKYIDVLERTLYNAALDGLSLSGDKFFYGNPLASPGRYERSEWFGTACCPANIARLVASLGNYVYNQSGNGIWVNLFISSIAEANINENHVWIEQRDWISLGWKDQYQPADPESEKTFDVHIRIPGWVSGQAVPGDLYYFIHPEKNDIRIRLNGKDIPYTIEKGYAVIKRAWRKGDQLKFRFSHEADAGCCKSGIESR